MKEITRRYVVLFGSLLLLALPFLGAEAVGDQLRIAATIVAACLVVLWRERPERTDLAGGPRWWKTAGMGALGAVVAVTVLEVLRGAQSPEALGENIGAAAVHGAITSQGMLALILLFWPHRLRVPTSPALEAANPTALSHVQRPFASGRRAILAAGLVVLALIGFAAVSAEPTVTGTWVLLNRPQFRFTVQEAENGRIEGSGGAGASRSSASFDISGRRVRENVSLVLRTGGGTRYGFEGAIVDEDWLYGTMYGDDRPPFEVQFHRE